MSYSNVKIEKGPERITGALALANASLIVAGVVKGLAGKNIADSINGSPLMRENIAQMACTRIIKQLQARDTQARDQRLDGYKV